MSYLETKKDNGVEYVSFVKKLTFMQMPLVIKKHIGKNTGNLTKEEFLLKHIEEITQIELDFRKKFLAGIKRKISHSETFPEKVEKKSILLDNYVEAKDIKEKVNNEFIKKFIFNSNHIEGSKIPESEVYKIIETEISKHKNTNEIREVKNSVKANEYVLSKKFRFNLASIKQLYHTLTKELIMDNGDPYPKGFKKVPIIVNNQTTTPPEKVEEELQELLDWYKENRKKVHPLILAFDFHKKYEKIHPFRDGNGRTGRMLMNKILTSGRYNPMIVFTTNRDSYFNALKEDKEKKYYQFMLKQADKSYEHLLKFIEEQ
jgi:Fic family protein